MKIKIGKARLMEPGKLFSFKCLGLNLKAGDICILKNDLEESFYGKVIEEPRITLLEPHNPPLLKALHRATVEDLYRYQRLCALAQKGQALCQEKIEEWSLPMKLICVHCTMDDAKMLFYMKAEKRIDFRQLVKELAFQLKMRIEFRQVGVRDEAKMIGGLGSCGRSLCCASFMSNFESISMRMAKQQKLVLNPTKLSGVCGRLMCCLQFEHEAYKEEEKKEALLLPHEP